MQYMPKFIPESSENVFLCEIFQQYNVGFVFIFYQFKRLCLLVDNLLTI